MDVIQAANEQMGCVRGEFEGMHDLCRRAGEQGKLLFESYPRLKTVNRARKNLERTLKEVGGHCRVSRAWTALLFVKQSRRAHAHTIIAHHGR